MTASRATNCLECGAFGSRVINSRPNGEGICRRRECVKCSARWTTLETRYGPSEDPMTQSDINFLMMAGMRVRDIAERAAKRRRSSDDDEH